MHDETTEVEKLEAEPGTYCMVCSDIKNFKLVNDIFGINVGDEVLLNIADALKRLAKPGSVYGRLSGDRFAICMPKARFNPDVFADEIRRIGEKSSTAIYRICVHVGVYDIVDRDIAVSVMCDRAYMAIKTIKASLADIYKVFTGLVEKYEIRPRNLRLEITESAVMSNFDKQLVLIQRLQEYGFMVEMDDFGSGYSSLNMLKDIPVDTLKVDMGFLRQTNNQERTAAEAAKKIPDGATIGVAGMGLSGWAEEIGCAIRDSFKETGHPCDLNLKQGSAMGDWRERGVTRLGEAGEGLITRWSGAHVGSAFTLRELAVQNKLQCHCLPQGVIVNLIAVFSKAGWNCICGCDKMNEAKQFNKQGLSAITIS